MNILILVTTIVFALFVFTVVIGELRYRKLKANRVSSYNSLEKTFTSDCIDNSLDNLLIESPQSGMIFSTTLQNRGSWRLAQNQILFQNEYSEMRNDEYSKQL